MKTLKVLLQEVVSGIKAWVNSNFAQESNTVHKTGNETVNGVKTFNNASYHINSESYYRNTDFSGKLTPETTVQVTTCTVANSNVWYGNQAYIWDVNGECYWRWNCGSFHGTSQGQGVWGLEYGVNRDFSSLFFRPQFDNSHNLGDSSHQWKSVYAKSYYYNGTAWGLDKINVWTNFNRFNGYRLEVKGYSQEIGVIPTSNQWNGFQFTDKNNNQTINFEHAFMGSGETRFKISMVDNFASNSAGSPVLIEFLRLSAYSGGSGLGVGANLNPLGNNLNLGTSTNKWKTLNGINPGALSLPDYNNVLDVTSEVPVASLDGNTDINLNDYVPDKTGWLSIVIANTTGNFIKAIQGRAGTAVGFNASRTYHSGAADNEVISLFMPIIADTWKSVWIKASSLIQMRFYYCRGNV